MFASTGKQPPIAEPRRANFPYERLPLPPPSPLLGWPIFRPLAFVFLLGERAGSRAINPCPRAPAARAALGTRGAGAALHGGGGELGLGGCQQRIWRAEVKGLDPCILQTGSRKGRCPGIPGRAQAVPPAVPCQMVLLVGSQDSRNTLGGLVEGHGRALFLTLCMLP